MTDTPHPEDAAERYVLGAVMLDAARVLTTDARDLTPDDFRQPAHAHAWTAARSLHDDGKPVSAVTVADYLKHHKVTDPAVALPSLYGMTAEVATPENADYYAEMIRQAAAGRRLDAALDAARAARRSGEAIDDVTAKLRPALDAAQHSTDRKGGELDGLLARALVNAAQIMRTEYPPPAWVVPGVIPDGYTVFTGAPKVGKSWLSLDTLRAVASGGRALGAIDTGTPRPVLYLALEDGEARLCKRLHILGAQPGDVELMETLTGGRVPDTLAVAVAERWMDKHGDERPVVCIDTLAKVRPPTGASAAYEADYAIGSRLKRLADSVTGGAVIAVHHTRKAASSDWMDSTSGTNGVNGAADATLSLVRGRSEGEGRLHFTGRDIEHDGALALTFDGGRWLLAGDSVADSLRLGAVDLAGEGRGDITRRILDVLAEHPEAGLSTANLVSTTGIERGTADKALARLVEAGRIERPARGVYRLPAL